MGSQPENYVVATERSPGNQTGNEPGTSFNCSKNRPTDIQVSEQHAKTTFTGGTTSPPLTITTPLIEEGLVRDEQTNEFHLPLTSTVVLKQKQERLQDFANNQTVYALVDPRAYVSAISRTAWTQKKTERPT